MAVPKRKVSRSRRDSKHAHKALTASHYYISKQSGQPEMSHRVDSNGYYNGVKVMEVNDGFTYPAVNQTIRVTVSAQ